MSKGEFGDIVPERGRLKYGYIKGVELADGTPVDIPLMVASGREDGPVLALTAGIHGTELIGVEVIRRILRERIDLRDLRGTIISIPIANPLAIQQCSYRTPSTYDGKDIGSEMPGNPEGSITQRLAAKIWGIISKAEYYVDLHCSGDPGAAIPLTILRPQPQQQKAKEMTRAVGLTTMIPSKQALTHRRTTAADTLGIPTVIVEIPLGRIWQEEMVEAGVKGVLNVLRYLGMLKGKPEAQKGFPVIKDPVTYTVLLCSRGGIMLPLKRGGDKVVRGEIIARIVNVFGDEVEQIKSPVDGYVMSCYGPGMRKGSHAVTTGDRICVLGYRES